MILEQVEQQYNNGLRTILVEEMDSKEALALKDVLMATRDRAESDRMASGADETQALSPARTALRAIFNVASSVTSKL
eukprot:CAMPEP_0194566328 /NCGR_PEP_ID=MMETSP0292-20121207/5259_1 /TAXON_ID=39354 /ORGANISM="Heterosigma akashiwo, Strain CCMP2393" /LENGTH=77 /DNA_ID=CAMNT_0039415899 /DNA_START=319 /DNA_END=552 /DNA_ORIENTATION=+